MKRSGIIFTSAFILLILGGIFAYQHRIFFYDEFDHLIKRTLPEAQTYQRITAHRASTSTSQTGSDSDVSTSDIPISDHLLVPFTSQAPKGNWEMPYQEACEEASLLMVLGYYKGDEGSYASSTADQKILDLVSFEEEQFGLGPDLTVAQAARVIEAYDSSIQADVVEVKDADQIKRFIADGVPVIVPADGKALKNPNFRNGGPVYHMLVITGYEGKRFITNDPGTRKGYDYIYDANVLMGAIHDWNEGDVPNGKRMMLILSPKQL
jgi:hypothetical protein